MTYESSNFQQGATAPALESDPMVRSAGDIWIRESTRETISQEMARQTEPTPAQRAAEEHKLVAQTGYTKEERQKVELVKQLVRDIEATKLVAGTTEALKRHGLAAEIILRPKPKNPEEAARHDAFFGVGSSEKAYQAELKAFEKSLRQARTKRVGRFALKNRG